MSSYFSDVHTDDDRKCQVIGCYKKHAYARTISGERVYSRYCADHTCDKQYSEAEGFHCATPRSPSDRFCPDHRRCGEPECGKLGEYVSLGPHEQWYCIPHRCSFPDCRSRVFDRHQRRCVDHCAHCTVAGCTRAAYITHDNRLAPVCTVHHGTVACLAPNCSRRMGTGRGPRPLFCPDHKCSITDCDRPRPDSPSPSSSTTCSIHACQSPLCPRPVRFPSLPGSAHCALHTCRSKSCTKPRGVGTSSTGDPTADFCQLHTCYTPGCRGEAAEPHTEHCARHACVVANCARERVSARGAAGGSLDVSGGGLWRDRCAEHAGARERRTVSLGVDEAIDYDRLKARFAPPTSLERKRASDDLERFRRIERERAEERESEARRERIRVLERELEERKERVAKMERRG